MGDIAERVYELKKTAIACGLEPETNKDESEANITEEPEK